MLRMRALNHSGCHRTIPSGGLLMLQSAPVRRSYHTHRYCRAPNQFSPPATSAAATIDDAKLLADAWAAAASETGDSNATASASEPDAGSSAVDRTAVVTAKRDGFRLHRMLVPPVLPASIAMHQHNAAATDTEAGAPIFVKWRESAAAKPKRGGLASAIISATSTTSTVASSSGGDGSTTRRSTAMVSWTTHPLRQRQRGQQRTTTTDERGLPVYWQSQLLRGLDAAREKRARFALADNQLQHSHMTAAAAATATATAHTQQLESEANSALASALALFETVRSVAPPVHWEAVLRACKHDIPRVEHYFREWNRQYTTGGGSDATIIGPTQEAFRIVMDALASAPGQIAEPLDRHAASSSSGRFDGGRLSSAYVTRMMEYATEMKRREMALDLPTVTIMIKAFARSDALSTMADVYNQYRIKRQQMMTAKRDSKPKTALLRPPDATVYHIMLSAYERTGDHTSFQQLMKLARSDGCALDPGIQSLAFRAACARGDLPLAERLMARWIDDHATTTRPKRRYTGGGSGSFTLPILPFFRLLERTAGGADKMLHHLRQLYDSCGIMPSAALLTLILKTAVRAMKEQRQRAAPTLSSAPERSFDSNGGVDANPHSTRSDTAAASTVQRTVDFMVECGVMEPTADDASSTSAAATAAAAANSLPAARLALNSALHALAALRYPDFQRMRLLTHGIIAHPSDSGVPAMNAKSSADLKTAAATLITPNPATSAASTALRPTNELHAELADENTYLAFIRAHGRIGQYEHMQSYVDALKRSFKTSLSREAYHIILSSYARFGHIAQVETIVAYLRARSPGMVDTLMYNTLIEAEYKSTRLDANAIAARSGSGGGSGASLNHLNRDARINRCWHYYQQIKYSSRASPHSTVDPKPTQPLEPNSNTVRLLLVVSIRNRTTKFLPDLTADYFALPAIHTSRYRDELIYLFLAAWRHHPSQVPESLRWFGQLFDRPTAAVSAAASSASAPADGDPHALVSTPIRFEPLLEFCNAVNRLPDIRNRNASDASTDDGVAELVRELNILIDRLTVRIRRATNANANSAATSAASTQANATSIWSSATAVDGDPNDDELLNRFQRFCKRFPPPHALPPGVTNSGTDRESAAASVAPHSQFQSA